MILEACVENLNEAVLAQSLGANRIELCENLAIGGTTPSAGTIAVAKRRLDIPIMVLIRPRGGNFVYSADEIAIIKHDISVCKKAGVHGIVVGCLTEENSIDVKVLEELIEHAKPLEITFHKAIDETPDVVREFRKLMRLDVNRVLTSGGARSAMKGKEIINQLVAISEDKIKVIAAGKVKKVNLQKLQGRINATEFHGKKIVGALNNSRT